MSNTYLHFVPLRSIKLTLGFIFADAVSFLLLVPSWISMVQSNLTQFFSGRARDTGRVKESAEAGHAPNCIMVEAINQSGARIFFLSSWQSIY